MKWTDITQKLPNLSKQLENIKSLRKKSTNSKKIILKTLQQPLQYWEMGLPTYEIQMSQKAQPIVNHVNITQEIPKLVPATEKS